MSDESAAVLCVDDSPDIAELLSRVFGRSPGLRSAGSVSSVAELGAAIADRHPDVVLLDLTIPGEDPLGDLPALAAEHASTRFVAFSGHDDPDTAERVLAAGAWGLISKDVDPAQLVECVRRVAAGEVVVCSRAIGGPRGPV